MMIVTEPLERTMISSSHPKFLHSVNNESRMLERQALLRETTATTTLSPRESADVLGFYNKTLINIDRIRFPLSFPEFNPSLYAAAPVNPCSSAGTVDVIAPLTEYPQVMKNPVSLDDALTASNTRKFYHGSPEEAKLMDQLDRAKKSGSRLQIRKASDELGKYFRQIINEDYENVTKEQMPDQIKSLKNMLKKDRDDIYVRYRLHVLSKKASEIKDQASMKDLEELNLGYKKEGSDTGRELAKFAKDHATGDGHHCYHYVAEGLDQIGINLSGGSAYMASKQLAHSSKVREVKGLKSHQLSKLPAGAIIVWNKGEGHPDGHISISLGNGKEVSDIERTQITDYGTSYRVFVPNDMASY